MSWSFEFTGTRDAVLGRVAAACDGIAKQYEGGQEGLDALAIKERAMALINALDLTPDAYVNWNGVHIAAGGSHSTSATKVWSANFTLEVKRVSLAL